MVLSRGRFHVARRLVDLAAPLLLLLLLAALLLLLLLLLLFPLLTVAQDPAMQLTHQPVGCERERYKFRS